MTPGELLALMFGIQIPIVDKLLPWIGFLAIVAIFSKNRSDNMIFDALLRLINVGGGNMGESKNMEESK
jgi:hypothetical protein